MKTDFLNSENINKPRCECCGHFLAAVPDWRDSGGCLSKYWECPICFSLAEEDFWKVVNKEKGLSEIVEDSSDWAPDTFAPLKALGAGISKIYADLINTGFVPRREDLSIRR